MTLADLPAVAALSDQEKLALADELYAAAETPGLPPVSPPLREELDRRLAAHLADPDTARSWDDVKARALDGVRQVRDERVADGRP